MSWLFPAFLAGGALVALPLILHFIRKKPREQVPFPTLRFLGKQALRDSKRHRIRRWLVLAMRCLLLLLFAAAFARPYWPTPVQNAEASVVVVLDNSASLHAEGRRDALLDWIREELNQLQGGDVVGVLAMHPQPHWLVSPDTQRDTALSRLDAWEPAYTSSNFRPAIRLGAQALAAMPVDDRRLLIATDHQALGWHGMDLTRPLPPGIKVAFAPAAKQPEQQAAVTEMSARLFPRSFEVTGRVNLFTPEEADETVVLRDESGKEVGRQDVTFIAGQPATVTFQTPREKDTLTKGFILTIQEDGMVPDNERHLVLDAKDGLDVLLDRDIESLHGTDFLRTALESSREGGLAPLNVKTYPDGDWPLPGVAVIRGSEALGKNKGKALEEWIRTGGNAWVMAGSSPEVDAWLKTLGVSVAKLEGERHAKLRNWATDHPLVKPFEEDSLGLLLDMEFLRGGTLEGYQLEPLAEWDSGGIAVADLRLGQGRVLVTGFDTRRRSGPWPLQASYLPFAHAALVWLGENQQNYQNVAVGDEGFMPSSPGTWRRMGTEGFEDLAEGAKPSDRPGLYRFQPEKGEPTMVAVNLAPEESNLSPWTQMEELAQLENPEAAPPRDERVQTQIAGISPPEQENDSLWWWLLTAVFLLLVGELALANRTAL